MIVKTSELTGAALDWAVAKADEEEWPHVYRRGVVYVNGPKHNALAMEYRPSTNWEQTSRLLDVEISVLHNMGDYWSASTVSPFVTARGGTPLVAACRAIVAAKLGDTVDAPEGLI